MPGTIHVYFILLFFCMDLLQSFPGSGVLHRDTDVQPGSRIFLSERIVPLRLDYKVQAEISGSTFEYSIKRHLKHAEFNNRKAFKVITYVSKPSHKTIDTFILDRNTLTPLERRIDQGSVEIGLTYHPEKIQGSIKSEGRKHPFEAMLNHEIIADGSGLDIVLASLKYHKGFSLNFKVFEFQTCSFKSLRLTVIENRDLWLGGKKYPAFETILQESGNPRIIMRMHFHATLPYVLLKSELLLDTAQEKGKIVQELESLKE